MYSQDCEFITNPGFEDIYTYSTRITMDQPGHSDTWTTEIDTSPFWNIVSKHNTDISIKQAAGYFSYSDIGLAFDGRVYVMIELCNANKDKKQRRIFPPKSIFLKQPLVKDSIYMAAFYLKPLYQNVNVDMIEVAFGKFIDPETYETFLKDGHVHNIKNWNKKQIKIDTIHFDNLPNDHYTKVGFKYRSVGGENVITLGNITGFPAKKYRRFDPIGYRVSTAWAKYFSYYSLDSLSIKGTCNQDKNELPVSIDTIYLSYDIDKVEPMNLNSMLDYNFSHASEIQIYCQADTTGTDTYNENLSQNRIEFIYSKIQERLSDDMKKIPIRKYSFGERENVYLPMNRREAMVVVKRAKEE
jgi:hypothetical protein